MKGTMKKVSLLAGMVSCCAMLSGCLTHWIEDSTTRLQVENRSSQTIVGVDILVKALLFTRVYIVIVDILVSTIYVGAE